MIRPLLAAFVGASVGMPSGASAPADGIFVFARIWAAAPDAGPAHAIAVKDGAILAVGTLDQMDEWKGERTVVKSWPSAIALPGLIDAHGHMTGLGGTFVELDVRGAPSAAAVAERVRRVIAEQPGDAWIVGRNWDQSLWPGMDFPTASVLDAVARDRPVWLRRVDGHAAWANSAAMRQAGVDEKTEAPPGGQIVRDDAGRPTGVFIDAAMGLIGARIPPPDDAEIERRLLAAQAECLRLGLTGVHDAGIGPAEERVYRALDRAGRLKLRVYAMASAGRNPVAFASRPPREGGERFQMHAIKLYADGAMGSRGALLHEPYGDDPSSRGLQLIEAEVLRQTTEAALRNGWQVCTHAIGDRGNAMVLDAYEAAIEATGARDSRLRIEHAQVIRRSDVERFKRLGIVASMQPAHVITDQRWADIRLGAGSERARGAYAWRWFLDAGVPLAFGSDFPVEVPDPLRGLHAAVARRDQEESNPEGWHPEQKLSLDEAIRGFTNGASYAGFSETKTGVIQSAARADVTVVDVSAFDALQRGEPAPEGAVVATMIDGEIVYERQQP